jgi:hypothetical protein
MMKLPVNRSDGASRRQFSEFSQQDAMLGKRLTRLWIVAQEPCRPGGSRHAGVARRTQETPFTAPRSSAGGRPLPASGGNGSTGRHSPSRGFGSRHDPLLLSRKEPHGIA